MVDFAKKQKTLGLGNVIDRSNATKLMFNQFAA